MNNKNIFFAMNRLSEENNLEVIWIPINSLLEKMDPDLLQSILKENIFGGKPFEDWLNE